MQRSVRVRTKRWSRPSVHMRIPEYAIEEYLEQRITECVQNKLYVNSGHREPVSLEQNFFVSCLNSLEHNAIKVRRNQEEVGRINSSTRLPARVPVSGVSKVSRWQRKTGAKGRIARPRRRETSRRRLRMQPSAQEKKEKQCHPSHHVEVKKNGAQGGQSILLNRTLGKTT